MVERRRTASPRPARLRAGALALTFLFAAMPSVAGARHVEAVEPRSSVADVHTAMFELEGNADALGARLQKALHGELVARDLISGDVVSISELRLAMGCRGDDVACLARGGRAMGLEHMVVARLDVARGAYVVVLRRIDVADGSVTVEARVALSAADLSRDTIDATAAKLVQSLMPEESDDAPPPSTDEPEPEITTKPAATPTPTQRERNYEWGRQRPAPRCKTIGLGVTAGLGGAALITGAVMLALARTRVRGELLDAVDASNDDNGNGILDVDEPDSVPPEDRNVGNNISRGEPDLCAAADERPNPADPSQVRNRAVTQVCNKAHALETGSIAALATGAVLGAAAIAFTVLLFVRKKKGREGAAALLRHDFRLGIGPDRGGMRAGVGFRF